MASLVVNKAKSLILHGISTIRVHCHPKWKHFLIVAKLRKNCYLTIEPLCCGKISLSKFAPRVFCVYTAIVEAWFVYGWASSWNHSVNEPKLNLYKYVPHWPTTPLNSKSTEDIYSGIRITQKNCSETNIYFHRQLYFVTLLRYYIGTVSIGSTFCTLQAHLIPAAVILNILLQLTLLKICSVFKYHSRPEWIKVELHMMCMHRSSLTLLSIWK